MLLGIHIRHRSAVFRRDERPRAVRQKRRRAWTRRHLERLQQLLIHGVDDGDLAVFFRRHVHNLTIGPQIDAFRLAADFERRQHRAVRHCDNARLADIFVGDEQVRAIGADGELLRIEPARMTRSSFRSFTLTIPMPSAFLSAGGSVLSSTPGGAMGEPLSATNT